MVEFSDVYRGRRVLVTGHTGFKGSWLTLWLTRLGAQVAGYSIGTPTNPSNFELLGLAGEIEHLRGDIRDREGLRAAIDAFRPEVIFHLAAQALVRRSYADPVTTFETNAMGMVNLLECVRNQPSVQVAVLITSDKAYRNDEWCWGYRETDPLGGHDPYSGSKSCADLIAQSYHHAFLRALPVRIGITRAGNVIGGGDWADDRIVPDAIRAWSSGESVAVRSPRATRPWQHVLEPLSGYLWLGARLWERQAGLDGEAFNFGPDAHVNETVSELLTAMATQWPGAQWHVPHGFETAGQEATLLKLSCDKALFNLDWRPVLTFDETVDFTIQWYRAWHAGAAATVRGYAHEQIARYADLAASRDNPWIRR